MVWVKHLTFFEMSGAFYIALEIPPEDVLSTFKVVLITASGLQGEKPLVDRLM